MYKNTIAGPRMSGKTTALARLVASAATENFKTMLVIGHELGQYPRLHIVLELEKWNVKIVHAIKDAIYLDNGTIIYFAGLNGKYFRGASLDMLAIDQVDALADDALSGLIPCVKPTGSMIQTVTTNV